MKFPDGIFVASGFFSPQNKLFGGCVCEYCAPSYDIVWVKCAQFIYSELNDEQLDTIVSQIQVRFSNAGNRQMYGLLFAYNFIE